MSVLYIGGTRRETITFTDDAGALQNVTGLELTLPGPDGVASTYTAITTPPIGNPSTGVYNIYLEPAIAGEWVGVWTCDGPIAQSAPIQFTVSALPHAFVPTVSAIAAVMRARTLGAANTITGQFSDETPPTGDQAQEVILRAAGDIIGRVGAQIPDTQRELARSAILYKAAYLIEIGYFPEQVSTGRSPADHYDSLWREALNGLEHSFGRGPDKSIATLTALTDWAAL